VGANAPGIIAPLGFCRIGFQPLPTFAPGHVGIVAKSGTLSYEAVASITRAGLGQSLVIGMGGDIIAGTNLVDSLRVFETDAETEVIVLIGEVGGRAEEDAADWIQDYLRREKNPKPIAALVGGRCARPQTIMGHAGAWAAPGENSAERKHSILEEAGATMVDHPEQFGGVIQTLLRQSGRDVSSKTNVQAHQRRGYHTSGRHPRPTIPHTRAVEQPPRRTLYISPEWAPVPLYPWLSKIKNLSLSFDDAPRNGYYISISIDRSARSPCLAVAPTTDPTEIHAQTQRFPYDALSAPAPQLLDSALHHLGLGAASAPTRERIAVLITSLAKMYRRKEAITLSCCISLDPASSSSSDPAIHLHQNTITLQFDDSAHRSAQRQPDIHALRQPATEDATELAAEAAGIVLVKFADPAATIGTLVNGAGLAMNTVDALRRRGGRATNFLDTGGKATRDTVKRSFELILRDRRVRVIFVNIFGGLTDGGMIAEGILLAFREVDMRNVPVVVRIRGTNEKVGQRIIAESGLGLDAFDGFEEAAKRVIELANRSSSSSSSSSSS
jgi:succinyl-CoA synthetase alpha subunit